MASNLARIAEYSSQMTRIFSSPDCNLLNCHFRYEQYEQAVYRCLIDRVPESESDTTVSVIMVLGAGRGPILRMALKAAKRAKRKVKCYAVEKNRNAAVWLIDNDNIYLLYFTSFDVYLFTWNICLVTRFLSSV